MGIFVGTTEPKIYVGEGGGNDYSAMQGPCPVGYHVPTNTEWAGLRTIMVGLGLSSGNNFKINLHLPFAGHLRQGDGTLPADDDKGYYFASTTSGAAAYRMYLTTSSSNAAGTGSRASGYSVRAFKDTFEVPNSNWTVINGTLGSAGIFRNQTDGIISITSDGSTGYTIMDKNLGATTVYSNGDTLSQANCGYFFQRGNNNGFPRTGATTTSETQIDTTGYGPGNFYSSSTFITVTGDWSNPANDNLRGGVTGITKIPNVREVYKGTTKIRPIMSYSDILSMATAEGNPRTNTIAELNTAPTGYYNLLNNGGYLTTNYIKYFNSQLSPGNYPTIDGITLVTSASSFYIAYSNGTWALGQDTTK